jgi:hypothetical protein
MDTNCLTVTVDATHQSLQQRLEEATHARTRPGRPREVYARTDAFMAATSRHLAAVEEVLVPLALRLDADRREVTQGYLVEARRLEEAVTRLKARLYGELHAAYLSWHEVWDEVRRTLECHNEAERDLVSRLMKTIDGDEAADVAMRLYRAELRAPTRAHPHLPHTGLPGLVARRIWAVADRFWDTAENRAVPPPVRPHARRRDHESLISQYLTGEPTLDADAPVLTHREHGRRARA